MEVKLLAFTLFIALFSCASCHSTFPQQNEEPKTNQVFISEYLTADLVSDDTKAITKIWQGYLEQVIKQDRYFLDSLVWDVNRDSFAGVELFFHLKSLREPFQAEILTSQKLDSNTFSVKTAFYEPSKDAHHSLSLNSIYDVLIKKEQGEYKAQSVFKSYTQDWQTTTVGNITYHYPQGRPFDHEKAQRMVDYCDTLKTIFWAETIPQMDYYIFANRIDFCKSQGFLFERGMYDSYQSGGQASRTRNIIYAANNSEMFPHEVIHLFTTAFHSTLHPYFDEGLSEYYDFLPEASAEKKENRHKLALYLADNPELDLSNMLDLENDLARGIDLQYDLSCLIIEKMIAKKGDFALQEIVSGGVEDADFYRTIETVLEIPRKQFNATFRDWLQEYL